MDRVNHKGPVINYGEGEGALQIERGWASQVLPLQKRGGGEASAMLKGGHKKF